MTVGSRFIALDRVAETIARANLDHARLETGTGSWRSVAADFKYRLLRKV
jgi:hypothetical protein